MNPDFQRGHVWTGKQQSSYIEYLLKGGQAASIIYFNKPSWLGDPDDCVQYDEFVCVDGLQRLTSVMGFMNNKIKAFDYKMSEFEGRVPINMDLLFNVNNLKTKKEVLQWYIEFNAGGTPHTEDEIDRVKTMIGELGN